MGSLNANKKTLITTKGIDTTSLIDKTAFRGIQYNRNAEPAVAEKDSKNYVTAVQFPVITCDDKGALTGTYTKDGEQKTSHGYSDVSMNVNIATMSDVYSTLAKEGGQFGIDVDDNFASERSHAGVAGVPMAANINLGGKTTFEIDAQALASVTAEQRNAANRAAGNNARQLDTDPSKARLSLTMEPVKATVDGVGKVSKESLNKALVQTATTSYIASNSERSLAQGNEPRNTFDKATIDKTATLMTKAYEKAFKDVADALASGSKLEAVKSAKDGKSAIAGTSLEGVKNVKLIDSKGVKAFVQNPACSDTKAINNEMRTVAGVVAARANAYVAQAAYNDKDKLGTGYNLAQATNFSVNAVGLKQTIDGKTQNAGVAVLSPSTTATITPTGANATRLNAACKGDEAATKAIVGPTVFAKAEEMAKASINGPSGRSLEQAREAQNKVIDAVKADVDKAAKSFDSIGMEKGGKQMGE